ISKINKMKIILVEDDKFFREFYAQKLREKGMEVFQAGDGEEGLRIVTESKPDIILLDLIMPVKDGFEVLEGLSQNPMAKNVPVLVFSTLGQDQDIQKAMSLGAKGYVNKSFFDFATLLSRILELTNKPAPVA
ncbi:MAG TPA: response regulator, partial [Xanthomonadales bacterium]|nr:response regulator [Xanthomonadales bacterium]